VIPLTAAAFAVVETFAIIHDRRTHPGPQAGATLSDHLRRWFSVKTNLGRTAFLVVFGAFVAWFFPHVVLGW
jgi:hypothetical protein